MCALLGAPGFQPPEASQPVLHPDTELFFAGPPRGHGARALAPIPAGTVVWTLCGLDRVLGPSDVARLGPAYAAVVEHFSYRDHQGRHVLCWDAGRYVNHSCRPSMRGLGPWAQIAVVDIAAGEEITCDYGECNISEALRCACGEGPCRGQIRGEDVLALAPEWDREVATAIAAGSRVPQPLRPFWRDPDYMDSILAGRLPAPSTRELHFRAGRDADPG